MKHVWMLNHYAQEPGGPGGTRHFALARHLGRFGWQTHIVAASFDHFSGRQRLAAGETSRLEERDGVPFLWVRTPGYVNNGMRRVAGMVAYSLLALRPGTTRGLPPPDVVLGSSVHPLAPAAAALVAQRFGVPFVFEVRDLWPETLIAMGRLQRGSPAARALHGLETWLYRRAARIVVLLPRAADYIEPLGIARDKIVWIPNGVDLAAYAAAPPSGDGPVSTIVYFGAHGGANDIDHILEGFAAFLRTYDGPPIRLRFVGDGPEKPRLVALARSMGLGCVSFEPPVPKREVPLLAAQADAFVVNIRELPELYRYGVSLNKVFEYMASARPVLIALSAANDPVGDAGAGITVPPGDVRAMAAGFSRLVALPPAERREMGLAGRRYIERNHDYAVLAGRMAAVLDAAVARRARPADEAGAGP